MSATGAPVVRFEGDAAGLFSKKVAPDFRGRCEQ